ncbi:ABC transporter permease [Subtercola boreus]|uniref:Nitrate ABC transporter permease n=1 Tax=Subtercola boreus TaxID=120213 RepID=A0A3E0WDW3_9MICO|nr:ABC transporter permease [Subtercola boreus]RFA21994.1 nitrate ABC transporter permease [Subtercola boreus]RFA22174.1 nitrate ABC transporter permease [Subtercola boreus]RFA28036.1 nitrate ABC transporter permease [Subtercola boreus]
MTTISNETAVGDDVDTLQSHPTPGLPVTATVAKPKGKNRITKWLPPLIVFLAIVVVWYLISLFVLNPALRFLLPLPQDIIMKGFIDPLSFNALIVALWQTVIVSMLGLAIAIVIGVAWAVAMSQAKWIERSLFPYAVILQCIPILALVPLIGFWFGYEFQSRVLVCVMIALFPMVNNTLFGLQSVDKGHKELFKLQDASRTTTLLKLSFPAALPAIFAGMRISAGLAVVGAIVGDQFFRRGTPGLGILISNYSSRLQGEQLFATIITAALFGVVIFWLFGLLGRRAVGKWYDFN